MEFVQSLNNILYNLGLRKTESSLPTFDPETISKLEEAGYSVFNIPKVRTLVELLSDQLGLGEGKTAEFKIPLFNPSAFRRDERIDGLRSSSGRIAVPKKLLVADNIDGLSISDWESRVSGELESAGISGVVISTADVTTASLLMMSGKIDFHVVPVDDLGEIIPTTTTHPFESSLGEVFDRRIGIEVIQSDGNNDQLVLQNFDKQINLFRAYFPIVIPGKS